MKSPNRKVGAFVVCGERAMRPSLIGDFKFAAGGRVRIQGTAMPEGERVSRLSFWQTTIGMGPRAWPAEVLVGLSWLAVELQNEKRHPPHRQEQRRNSRGYGPIELPRPMPLHNPARPLD